MNIAVMGDVIHKLSLFYFHNFLTNDEKDKIAPLVSSQTNRVSLTIP